MKNVKVKSLTQGAGREDHQTGKSCWVALGKAHIRGALLWKVRMMIEGLNVILIVYLIAGTVTGETG